MSSMNDGLWLLATSVALAGVLGELVGAATEVLWLRRALYGSVFLLTGVSAVLFLIIRPDLGAVLFAILSLFRLFNAARVLRGRMKPEHTLRVTRRTSYMLLLWQAIAAGLWLAFGWLPWRLQDWLALYGFVLLASSAVVLLSALHTLGRSRLRVQEQHTELSKLPTVSVCVPARNETAALPACLRSILDSRYPKLEVLVLDDCSQDKTSDIIKKFAHDGVRFIQGDEPRTGWLSKNQAYENLRQAAEGDVLLFCGVDVRMDPEAIGRLVNIMQTRKKKMLSVMPLRADAEAQAGVIQPMRYWWEIALPRRLLNRPPVLSTVWMINARVLKKMGGLTAVNNTIIPEAHFARQQVATDSYSFIRAGHDLGITSVKSAEEQLETAIRTRYAQLRKRPEVAALVLLAELGLGVMPFVLAIGGLFVDLDLLWPLALVAALYLTLTHVLIVNAWSPDNWLYALSNLPFALLTDACLVLISMWQYEFGTVTWKDRNICIPVMHVIPRLPELKD